MNATPIDPHQAGPPVTAPAPKRKRGRRRIDLQRELPRLLGVIGLLLLVNVLVWAFVVRPREADVAQLADAKASADRTEAQASKRLKELIGVHDHVLAIQDGVARFYGEMLSSKRERMVPFQRALDGVGKEFNVKAERVSIGTQPLENEGIEAMAFGFPLTAGYENLRNFLARLEELQQFLIVREVSLGGDDEGGRMLRLNVSVETYFNAPELLESAERDRREKATRGRSTGRRAVRRGGDRR